MTTYTKQIESTKQLIKRKGQLVTWRSVANGNPTNSNEPWKAGAPVYKNYAAVMVFLPATKDSLYLLRETEIPKGDLIGLMGAVSFKPTLKDVVIRDGKTLSIVSIDEVAPAGETILYTIGFSL